MSRRNSRRSSRSRRSLVQSAIGSKSSTFRHSAYPLISTVPDDTTSRRTRQVRPNLGRFSPVLASRASHRVQSIPRLLSQVISGVQLPQRAINCAKRSIRKEVLFALKLRGKGSAAPSRRRTNESKEKCK